ncbi:hypothetical protein DFH27DRAFT_527304 [Peziza echinospora]|nr:hypothetical protein DFH27DRAFT_527304 [Peziza echinospora]
MSATLDWIGGQCGAAGFASTVFFFLHLYANSQGGSRAAEQAQEIQARALCNENKRKSTVHDNKLYVIGGSQAQRIPGSFKVSAAWLPLSNSFLRIIDFSTSVELPTVKVRATKPVHNVLRLDKNVPIVKHGDFFATSTGIIRFFGGLSEMHPTVTEDGIPTSDGRVSYSFRMNTFDIATSKWSFNPNHPGIGDIPAGYTTRAFDATRNTAYLFGGLYIRYGYNNYTGPTITSNVTWVANPPALQKSYPIEFRKYDAIADRFTDVAAPPSSLFAGADPVKEEIRAVSLPTVGKNGTVVILSGRDLNGFKEAYLFDVETEEWYVQTVTSETGVFPSAPKANYCLVYAPAPDGSSHNIYLFAGSPDNSYEKSLNEVFILTLPAFRWITVPAKAVLGTIGSACGRVQDKYMVSYMGNLGVAGCLEEVAGLQVLDMSTLEWTRKVVAGSKYEVPKRVYDVIGGGPSGNATSIEPIGTKFVSAKINEMFKYSYSNTNNTNNTNPNNTGDPETTTSDPAKNPDSTSNSSSLSGGAIGGIVIGSVFGLAFLLFLFLFFRRRHRRNPHPITHPSELPAVGGRPAELPPLNPYQEHYSGGAGKNEMPGPYNSSTGELPSPDQVAVEMPVQESYGKSVYGEGHGTNTNAYTPPAPSSAPASVYSNPNPHPYSYSLPRKPVGASEFGQYQAVPGINISPPQSPDPPAKYNS